MKSGRVQTTMWYAFEIETTNGYYLYVHESEEARDKELKMWLEEVSEEDTVTYAVGYVECPTKEEAKDRVAEGDWNFSQKA